ncbi:MAG TPA: hypothetical protein VK049_00565 [Paenalcaligenes sp.]|nr:hypothetical protein [Paenalcaligenes sp.]
MVRCVRLFTNEVGQVQAQEGVLQYEAAERGDHTTQTLKAGQVFYQSTAAGSSADWHVDTARQFVITLQGHLVFETETGQSFEIQRGDILLTEETAGKGHRWRMVGDAPWVRAYVTLPADAAIPFSANP